jgi:hypothetical protein
MTLVTSGIHNNNSHAPNAATTIPYTAITISGKSDFIPSGKPA